jgi:hypothetical protein
MDSLVDLLAMISKHEPGPIPPSPLTTCERSTVEPRAADDVLLPTAMAHLRPRPELSASSQRLPARTAPTTARATPALRLVVNFSSLLLSSAGVGTWSLDRIEQSPSQSKRKAGQVRLRTWEG